MNLTIAMSAGVDPVPGHVAERNRQRSVLEHHEVVDVAADLDPRGGSVDGTNVQALDLGLVVGQERALHGIREGLLLLVQARIVDRECGLPHDRERHLDRLVANRPLGAERDEGNRRQHLLRRRDGEHDRRRAALQERPEQAQ